ncbi:nuclear pore complex protein Nup107 [Entomortierella parvispora]|uniref:Nuclear pore complex protein n=1 Tax=Entomortierella parvispora TaxID=205924 RepID=A0A9P3HJM4_9FUNG|nr:nuclear pore complex protein Nup107 [Entomortierella parvispora]
MAWNSPKAFTGFSLPGNAPAVVSTGSAFKNMDVTMQTASPSSLKANDTTPTGELSSAAFGKKDTSFEIGIEHQKFARVVEAVQRRQRMSNEDVSFASVLPQFDVLCFTRARLLGGRKESDANHQTFGSSDEYKLWQQEGQTWVLLTTLFTAFANNKAFIDKGSEALQWSDLDLIEHLASTDAEFKHHSAVKAWLEITAPPFRPQIRTKLAQPLPSLSRPSMFSSPSRPTASTNRDPDAVSREGFKPSEQNQRIEQDLLKTVWEYVRRGDLKKAQEACTQAGESWRADSIGGGQLCSVSIMFTDPQYDRSEAPVGNEGRGLWKGTCYALAQDNSADQFERAVYGALSGDVDTVLPVCSSWEDHAWVRYNSLVESMIEARLSQFNRGEPSKALPIPKSKFTNAKDIFDSLNNSDSQELRAGAKDMFKEIQTSIILGTTDQLLVKLAQNAKLDGEAGAPLKPHMLRFLAHFVLLLRSTGSNVPQLAGDYFIKTYADILISKKMYDLAPLYISYLPYDLQVATCSSYLKTIDGAKSERQHQIKMLHDRGLDSRGILAATVDGLLGSINVDFAQDGFSDNLKKNMTSPVSSQERAHIQALEWLSFDSSQFDECLHRSNQLTRKYLAQGRLNTAFALYNSLPTDIVLHEIQQSSPAYAAISNEHLYYRDLFTARLYFEEWKDALSTKPSEDAPSTQQHAWESDFKGKAHRAITEIETLLQTRWLSDCMVPGDVRRNQELMQLRQIYVSELVMNLHQVYYESRSIVPEYLAKSVEMANMVASETTAEPLYKELQDASRLQEFLRRVRLSSLELLKDGRSPFAF